jgi:hypothetical protein
MEKFYSKMTFCKLAAMALFAFCGFNQKTYADLPTVSTEGNEVWYYIENGHNANGRPTNNDGRFCGLITSNGESVSADMDLILPTAERGAQRWKIVAVPDETGFYYLINQNGEYFYRASAAVLTDSRANYANTVATGDSAKYELLPQTNSQYYVIHRKNGGDNQKLTGLNGGNSWTFQESNGAVNAANSNSGLHNSPRAWRFVPVEEIDNFYPDIFAQGTAVGDVVSWYFIKSLDPAASAPYLTLKEDGSGFELQGKKSDNIETQLFGFISNGKKVVGAGTSNTGGHLTHIVNKADPTKFLNQATAGAAYNWYLEHVVAPAKSNAIQGTIRTDRHMDFLIANETNITIQAKVANVNNGDGATTDTYNNQYSWAYESAPKSLVTVSTGTNITITETSPELISNEANVSYDNSITIIYTVPVNYAPIVIINSSPVAVGTLKNTDESGTSTYELTIPHITEAVNVSIDAENAIPVTVNATNVTIISPTLDDQNQYTSASSSVITFSLNDGYENPTVTLDDVDYTLGEPTGGVYSITLDDPDNQTPVAISATIKTYTISWTGGEGVEITSPGESVIVDYNTTNYAVSFKLDPGYHSPKVFVNGKNQAFSSPSEEGLYVISLFLIKEAKTIEILAFPANVLPVTADTYVSGGDYATNTHASEKDFRIQRINTNAKWTLRSYLQFDIPQAIQDAGYDKASLQLVFSGREKSGGTQLLLEIRSTTITGEIANLNWNINGEQNTALTTSTLATELLPYDAIPHTFDISDVLTDNDLSNPITLQLSANETTQTNSDGWYGFYSLEGAIDVANIDYIPVLIFEKSTPPTGIDEIDGVKSTVIAEKYYTLQGVEVEMLRKGEIYIVKKIYDSAKTSVAKILIQ